MSRKEPRLSMLVMAVKTWREFAYWVEFYYDIQYLRTCFKCFVLTALPSHMHNSNIHFTSLPCCAALMSLNLVDFKAEADKGMKKRCTYNRPWPNYVYTDNMSSFQFQILSGDNKFKQNTCLTSTKVMLCYAFLFLFRYFISFGMSFIGSMFWR